MEPFITYKDGCRSDAQRWIDWLSALGCRHSASKLSSLLPTAYRLLPEVGGADRDRTGDPLLAKQVLSQLSYSPR